MVPHVSYSSWQLFRRICEHRWRLDYLEERRSENFSPHMDFGTSIHESIELYRSPRPNPHATVDAVCFFFREKFRWLYGKHHLLYPRPTPESLEKRCEEELQVETGPTRCVGLRKHKGPHQGEFEFFLEAGECIIRKLHECDELWKARVVYNEHALLVPIDRLDGVPVSFKGFIDMVIMTRDKRGRKILYVCDFKTCSWGWPVEKKTDRELHYQILLYKYFLCKKFNLDPSLVRTAFVLLKKRPRPFQGPVEWVPISAGPVAVQRAVDELNSDITRMIDRVRTGEFKKNRDSCVTQWGDRCPYAGSAECPEEPTA